MSYRTPDGQAKNDPIFVTEQDLEDLATFTGMSQSACLERLRTYSHKELADAWRKAEPKTPEEVKSFYQQTDLLVWSLMQWHASVAREPYWRALDYLFEAHPPHAGWKRVFDFGCGIGTDALFLAERGYELTLVDVDSPTLRFARHRIGRRKLKARFVESVSNLPEPDSLYDVVLCFDVFEHLPSPLAAAERLVGALRRGGLMIQQGAFADYGDHPCHLSDGIRRFGGLKWHIYLTSLGLKGVAGLVYRKVSALERLSLLARYAFWKATGLWVSRVE